MRKVQEQSLGERTLVECPEDVHVVCKPVQREHLLKLRLEVLITLAFLSPPHRLIHVFRDEFRGLVVASLEACTEGI